MNINYEVGFRGEQNIQVLRDGKVVRETGFQKNVILDEWFTRLLTQNNIDRIDGYSNSRCVVGTGTTAPNPTQTSLISYLAGTSGSNADITVGSNGIISNYKEVWVQRIFNFAEGAVVGNIAEVGTTIHGTVPSSGTPLLTRALVLDVNGNPTTIAVTAQEQLRVIHRLYTRLSNVPVTGTLALTTGGNTLNYNYDIRLVDAANTWGRYGFLDDPKYRTGVAARGETVHDTLTHGTNLGNPSTSGASAIIGNGASAPQTLISVVKNGLSVSITWEIPAISGNLVSGIGGIRGGSFSSTEWAISFTPKIPKTSLNKFRYTITFTFARA